jgi:anti-anti-sigma regulatory factor
MLLAVTKHGLTRRKPRRRVIGLSGSVGAAEADHLVHLLLSPDAPKGVGYVDLDFAKVSAIGSEAVAALYHAYFALRGQGTELRVLNCLEQPRSRLETCGLHELPGVLEGRESPAAPLGRRRLKAG